MSVWWMEISANLQDGVSKHCYRVKKGNFQTKWEPVGTNEKLTLVFEDAQSSILVVGMVSFNPSHSKVLKTNLVD